MQQSSILFCEILVKTTRLIVMIASTSAHTASHDLHADSFLPSLEHGGLEFRLHAVDNGSVRELPPKKKNVWIKRSSFKIKRVLQPPKK